MLEKIGGIAQMPPDVWFCNLPHGEAEDHRTSRNMHITGKEKISGRQTSPGSYVRSGGLFLR